MDLIRRYSLVLTCLIAGALAHSNGMDMDMDQGMDMNMGNMIMYFHFTLGDNLWFFGWAPRSAGAMAGACIGLLILAMVERWLVAMRGVMEGHWRTRALIALSNELNASVVATSRDECTKPSSKDATPLAAALPRPNLPWHQTPPFIVAYDIPRGIMQLVVASINVLFMLTIMTFQLGFIFAIVVGLGIGEAFFGRYSLQLGHS
ncbi:Ctr copper transporter family-domain-containing protein [Russula dissimulans]|nr:Ctr copper transporter family-domain-containing protein [Russula dissimulans]